MRFKVELHPDVQRFIQRCTSDERQQFRAMLQRISEDPIQHSTSSTNPKLSRYVVRFGRFGPYVAIFGFDRARETIRIRQCQRAQQPDSDEPQGASEGA